MTTEQQRAALAVIRAARAYRAVMPVARFQDEQGAEATLDAALQEFDVLTPSDDMRSYIAALDGEVE